MSGLATKATELVPINGDVSYTTVQKQVEELVQAVNVDDLTEAKARAEAHSLYEQRSDNEERARYFWTLKAMAEAGLGVIAFDHPEALDGILNQNQRAQCKTLACAFERGVLGDLCKTGPMAVRTASTSHLVYAIRQQGYTFCPTSALGVHHEHKETVRWGEARQDARDQGIPLTNLPPDTEYVKRRQEVLREGSRRMRRSHEAFLRYRRMKRQEAVKDAAKAHPGMSETYALLRRTLQATHEAYNQAPRYNRPALDKVFWYLHEAEDEIARYLRADEPGLPEGRFDSEGLAA